MPKTIEQFQVIDKLREGNYSPGNRKHARFSPKVLPIGHTVAYFSGDLKYFTNVTILHY
jgi:hypothetical protein